MTNHLAMEKKQPCSKKLADICARELIGFGVPIPERCQLCTDLVRYVLETLSEYPGPCKEEDAWRE